MQELPSNFVIPGIREYKTPAQLSELSMDELDELVEFYTKRHNDIQARRDGDRQRENSLVRWAGINATLYGMVISELARRK